MKIYNCVSLVKIAECENKYFQCKLKKVKQKKVKHLLKVYKVLQVMINVSERSHIIKYTKCSFSVMSETFYSVAVSSPTRSSI